MIDANIDAMSLGHFFLSGDPLVLRGKRGGSVVANNGGEGRGREGHKEYYRAIEEIPLPQGN